MTTRAVLFDLDGTLLDTLADIAHAANAVLAAGGFPTHEPADYRRFIGDGVPVLFRKALPEDQGDRVDDCVEAFREFYGRAWDVRTRPYPGIPELLDELTGRGLILGVLSNKPDDFTRLYAEKYLSRWPFNAVRGARERVPRKPDPAAAWEVAAELGVATSEILYLGDSGVDMETARRAGMWGLGASWGFRPVEELHEAGARAVIDHPSELLTYLDRA